MNVALQNVTALQVTTLIGYGSPNKAGSHDVHGAPLGASETEQTREKLAWKYGEFEVPQEAYDVFGRAKEAGGKAEKSWDEALAEYGKKYPEVRDIPPSAPLFECESRFRSPLRRHYGSEGGVFYGCRSTRSSPS